MSFSIALSLTQLNTSMPEPSTLPEISDTPYSTLQRVEPPKFNRRKEWPQIHADIVTSPLTPKEICIKYDLRTERGTYAIIRVAQYRRKTLEKFKDLFAKANELEQQAIRGEVLGNHRHVFACAAEGHELAKSQKTQIGRGKNVTLIDAPDFNAMRSQQESMLNAATKLAEIAGVGPSAAPAPAPMYQDNRVLQVLALPKQENVPTRAPKVIEAHQS